MRQSSEVQLPINPDSQYEKDLNFKLKDIFRNLIIKLNGLSDGRISAVDNTATSIPTTGMYSVGDQVRNKAPAELGSAGSKYVVLGWVCVTAGSPGLFLPIRTLTGN